LTCRIFPHICAPVLLIFHPFPKKSQAALFASKRSKRTGGDGQGSHYQNRAGSQTGWDPCRLVKHSRSATERNRDLTETFLSVWTYPFKYTWENFTGRWRSATERKREV
jgi:hypothetical protein